MGTLHLVLELRAPPSEVCSRRTFEVQAVPEHQRQGQIEELVSHVYPTARLLLRGNAIATFQDDGLQIRARYVIPPLPPSSPSVPGREQLFAA